MTSVEAKLSSPAHISAPMMILVVDSNYRKSQGTTVIFTHDKLWEIFDKWAFSH